MREVLTVVTRKGQITVPAEFRRALGLRKGDKVALAIEGDRVVLRRMGSVVARTAGILGKGRPALSAEELREKVEQAIAEDVTQRMGQY
jgi:AbrB family looped-hinge helix DNA binding protein